MVYEDVEEIYAEVTEKGQHHPIRFPAYILML